MTYSVLRGKSCLYCRTFPLRVQHSLAYVYLRRKSPGINGQNGFCAFPDWTIAVYTTHKNGLSRLFIFSDCMPIKNDVLTRAPRIFREWGLSTAVMCAVGNCRVTGRIAMKQLKISLAVLLVASTLFTATAHSDEGQESPVATIGKSTFYGALTGLLVGGAAALVAGGSAGETMKWSFVAGTAVGFAWGVYDVNTRPDPKSAMLSLNSNGSATFNLPKPRLARTENGDLGLEMSVFSLAF